MGQRTSSPQITSKDRAILQLKQERDKLKQYQKKSHTVIDKQTALAREALAHKKIKEAKFYLRCKKRQQSVVENTYSQLSNLEDLIRTIEFKLIEKDVLYGLQQGNEVLKSLNAEMSVERIDGILDDLEEEKVKVEDVQDRLGLGSQLNNGEELQVEDELRQLEADVLGKNDMGPEIQREDIEFPEPPNDLKALEVEENKPKEEERTETAMETMTSL